MFVAEGVGGVYLFGESPMGSSLSAVQQFVYFYVNRAIVRK